MENSVHDDSGAGIISVSKIVNWEPATREVLIERKRPALPRGVHVVVMRQDLVPRISFHAKFEVAVPNSARNASFHKRRRHMIEELVATCDGVSQRREEFAWAFEDFRDGTDESLVITRLMPFDWWKDLGHDIGRAALLREKNLDARACGFRRLDKDEPVFMGNDHGSY